MTFLTKVKTALAAAALAVGGLAAAVAPASAEGLLETIQQRGKLMVGMSTFVPWAMRDKEGNLIGFEIDVATKLAEDMGVEIEFVPTAWSGIIPALLAEKFDVIIGGMSITPQRNLTVNFTAPYANSGQMMATNLELAAGATIESLNSSDVNLTCRRGVVGCTILEKTFPKANILQFDDDAQAFQEVLNGNAHGVISSAPKPAFWAEANSGKIEVAFGGTPLSTGNEGFALRKGDADALNFFSNWILVNRSNGWLAERHEYWFKGQSAWIDQVALEQ
ncbi:transporter substrate-binding domain-containing protein [uncultured Roseicyclus sp.]|jgi:polar amino acid transport system substrate-binding protein|uniref:transporter substrate-binding domain-containing protein n=1 Tax=uncultured Roseicyclus sp. TaxID=543072 RepID=UPI00261828A2|nr:transporter substrate-binding domain-containing protein [uncultured Roseicyclus sp.]